MSTKNTCQIADELFKRFFTEKLELLNQNVVEIPRVGAVHKRPKWVFPKDSFTVLRPGDGMVTLNDPGVRKIGVDTLIEQLIVRVQFTYNEMVELMRNPEKFRSEFETLIDDAAEIIAEQRGVGPGSRLYGTSFIRVETPGRAGEIFLHIPDKNAYEIRFYSHVIALPPAPKTYGAPHV